jgi:hypothetical protein
MDVVADLACAAPPARVFEVVADLATYPGWLEIVTRARAEEPPDELEPAWSVDLRGQVGPLRRTKRLRMVRTVARPSEEVRFERREVDGREHSPWVLSAAIDPTAEGARLTMRLHYGGRLWMPVLDRLLAMEIERSRSRLADVLAGTVT